MIQGFVKDLIKYLPAQIVQALVGFITIPIVTRLFLPADYGNYSLVLVTVSILTIIIDWIGMSIIRFYALYERGNKLVEFNNNISKLLLISLTILTILFLAIIFSLKSYISSQLWQLLLIGTLVFIFTASFQTLLQLLRVRMQVNWYTGFSIWNSMVPWGIGIALVVGLGFGIDGLLWGSILSTAVIFPLLCIVTLKGKISHKFTGISFTLSKEMAQYGFPLVVGNLAAWILSLSDRYILELFRGSQEVGIYSVSYNISQYSVLLLVTLITLASGPISMKIWEDQGAEKSKEFVNKITRYFLILCVPMVLGITILAKPIIEMLTPSEYYDGYRIMGLIALGVFFLGLQQCFQFGLLFYKQTRHIMVAIIISALLNLGLNFWLVPQYGYMGSAAATLVSYGALFIIMIFISRQYFIWPFPFKSMWKILLSSVVMGIVVYITNSITSATLINLITNVCVGIVVYILMLFLLREPQKEEIHELLSIRSKLLGKPTK